MWAHPSGDTCASRWSSVSPRSRPLTHSTPYTLPASASSAILPVRHGQSRPRGVVTPSPRRSGRASRPGGRRTCPGFCLKAAAPCATCRVTNARLQAGPCLLHKKRRRSWISLACLPRGPPPLWRRGFVRQSVLYKRSWVPHPVAYFGHSCLFLWKSIVSMLLSRRSYSTNSSMGVRSHQTC